MLSLNTMEEPMSAVSCTLNEDDFDENTDVNQRELSDTISQKGTNESSSDEEDAIRKRVRKRIQKFSDSDSESSKENAERRNINSTNDVESPSKLVKHTDSTKEKNTESRKIRIRRVSGSGSDTSHKSGQNSPARLASKNEGQQKRMESKRNRLKHKFKNLLNSRLNNLDSETKVDSQVENEDNHRESPDYSDLISIDEIKEKMKEKSQSIKMSICDPDTSDEEESRQQQIIKRKKERKSTQLTSPKPAKISAKQAMENMHKIKSESNRMLREKEVSLPYHRPKALNLKDILSRRKPALAPDGKILRIKMNEQELEQYDLSLKQRRKEIIELCKSDTDEENEQSSVNENMEMHIINSDDATGDKISEINPENRNAMQNIININTVEATNIKNVGSVNNDTCHLDDNSEKNTSNTDSDLKLVYNSSVEEFVNTDTEKIVNDLESVSEIIDSTKPWKYSDSEPQFDDLQNVADIIKDTDKQNVNSKSDISKINPASICEIGENNDVTDYNKHIMQFVIANTTNNPEEHKYNKETVSEKDIESNFVEQESQLISLHFDFENRDSNNLDIDLERNHQESTMVAMDNEFPDDDITVEDIDALMENAEILKNPIDVKNVDSPMLIRDSHSTNIKPTLKGAPGMIIDLDGTNTLVSKKLSGVELLKERFTYFAKFKTSDEMKREREKGSGPGTQHLKLKQELDNQIAEQHSLEWAKRLEDEKQQENELNSIGGDTSDVEDDIEKIEAKLEEIEIYRINRNIDEDSITEEEDIEEGDVPEKRRKRNPLIADEAEESDCDDEIEDQHIKAKISVSDGVLNDNDVKANEDSDVDNEDGDTDDEPNEEDINSSDESSESEEEEQSKPKKGRVLKAFEDSDDEDSSKLNNELVFTNENKISDLNMDAKTTNATESQSTGESQDDEMQLAQLQKSYSVDMFTTQESVSTSDSDKISKINVQNSISDETDLGTQRFSILNSASEVKNSNEVDLICHEKMSVIFETQLYDDANLDAVVGMCSGSFSQNLVTALDREQNSFTQSQEIGEDVLALCTGKFYDNQFVSQIDDLEKNNETSQGICTQDEISIGIPTQCSTDTSKSTENESRAKSSEIESKKESKENTILKDILEELNEPEKVLPKPKFFADTNQQNLNNQFKKKFIFDSDDDSADEKEVPKQAKKKKFKKRKLEQRALQISDDEEDECLEQEEEEYTTDIEDDSERIVEYDSEENEVEVNIQSSKKKRKVTEFFEKEAELTSDDEWLGSGDEDEAGLDRMEREAGDDDTFHQSALQAELGQIHIRDVLDQDKRDVRLLQELLFEDGDLGDGHRQRKFRWANTDVEEDTGTVPNEFADTLEEEFESEEQWRKQRHEREVFLKSMKQDETQDNINFEINRSTIIKANLCSKTMSSLLMEANSSGIEINSPVIEKKMVKDVPSPKKSFSILQQNYHGSLLARGGGALARLATLATPLAVDDDTTKVSSLVPTNGRNFVFATINRDEEKLKVEKRKAENNVGTPKLIKKMKTDEREKIPRKSLLDHLKA